MNSSGTAARSISNVEGVPSGQSDAPYAALAHEMNTSEGAIKVAIHRLRKRYRELFRQEIADTVADPEAVIELSAIAAVCWLPISMRTSDFRASPLNIPAMRCSDVSRPMAEAMGQSDGGMRLVWRLHHPDRRIHK